MENAKTSEHFTYWKRPSHKWIFLFGAILQFISLWLNISDYRDIANVKELVFSASEWENYTAQVTYRFFLNGVSAAVFSGVFLIGVLSRSYRVARFAEGIFLLLLTFVCGIVGFAFHFSSSSGKCTIWILIMIIGFAGGIYSLWQSRNSKLENQ